MRKPRRLGEASWLLPGSPNTIVVSEGDEAWIIDPGIGDGRDEYIKAFLKEKGLVLKGVLLTHGHTDHIAVTPRILSGETKVCAHKLCLGLIESLDLRFNLVYGGVVSKGFASMPPVTLKLTDVLSWGQKVNDVIETIDLHGHTPGHTGFIVKDGNVVVAGDSILGERVLERFGLPFASDIKSWYENLDKLKELANEGYIVIPGHGPVAEGKRAISMIDKNISAVEKAYKYVYYILKEKGGLTAEKLSVIVTENLSKATLTPRQAFLNRTTLISLLKWLEEDGKVKASVGKEGVFWKAL